MADATDDVPPLFNDDGSIRILLTLTERRDEQGHLKETQAVATLPDRDDKVIVEVSAHTAMAALKGAAVAACDAVDGSYLPDLWAREEAAQSDEAGS